VFTLLNHFMIGLVVWLARGENFLESGVFEGFTLMLDFTLLIMGAGAAVVWSFSQPAIVLIVIPLYLIYNTLRVPALERQTETDPKTGLYNARFFSQALDVELQKAKRDNKPLTVVMADLDLLRDINNTYGHIAGDEVLIGVAKIFKQSLRPEDISARFGGEEYAILIRGLEDDEVFDLIDGIRQQVEQAEFVVPSSVTPIKATMSFGIARRKGVDQFANDIIHNADLALYHAKLLGRNQTCIYTQDSFYSIFEKFADGQEAPYIPKKVSIEERVEAFSAPTHPFSDEASAERVAHTPDRPSDEKTEIEPPKPVGPAPAAKQWPIYLYIGALTAVALFMAVHLLNFSSKIDWLALGLLASLVVVAEWFSIDLYLRDTAVSTSAAPILAGVLLWGPSAAIILSLTFAISAAIKHRSQLNRLVFNFSNQLFAAMVYTSLILANGGGFGNWRMETQFMVCMASAAVVYFLTTAGVSIAVHLHQAVPIKRIWKEQYSWLAPMYLAIGVIGYALILIYQIAGLLGLTIVLVPMGILRLSQKQYMDHTRRSVEKLQESNARLEIQGAKISKLNEELLQSFSYVIDMRDPYVFGHSDHVVTYAVKIAKRIGLPDSQVELIRRAGLLHDIGKLGISEQILNKPERLEPHEFEVIKKHPVIGASILGKVESLQELVPIVRHHHERIDGRGYPDGLKGDSIPIGARIIALADAVEAMASDRPYKASFSIDQILEEIKAHSNTQFDPVVVNAFVDIIHEEGRDLVTNSARKKGEEAFAAVPKPIYLTP
jgi:diguanylate cyclase (GGDEF)-like protein/putative nucleotidyltransferase with HDIG domain